MLSPMARLLYVLNHATDLPERAMTALLDARAAAAAGHDVALWLQNDGVRLGVTGVAETLREPGPETAAEALDTLTEGGATLHCSARCFAGREFEEDALRAGAALASAASLAALVADGWIPISM